MNTPLLCAVCGTEGSDYNLCAACQNPPVLQDRFILRSIIGRGAAGTTYRADELETGEVVALKEMPLGHPDPKHLEQLNREARVLKQLNHPQIPSYIAHFTAGVGKQTAFYIAQEFIDGKTIAQEMEDRRYTESDVLDILDELLTILSYLHQLAPPVIHRDIKPKNLIRRRDTGELVLIDFGSVRDIVIDPKVGGSTIAGTYGYMAPEQYRGVALPQSDLYSVGVLMVVLLSRRDPIELTGPKHGLVWRNTVSASSNLCDLIDGLLHESYEERVKSAEDVLSAVRAVRRGEEPWIKNEEPGIQSEESGLALPLTMDRSLRKRLGARSRLLAVLAAILGGSVGGQYWYLGQYFKGFMCLVFAGTAIPFLWSSVWAFKHLFMSDEEFDQRYNSVLVELQKTSAQTVAQQLTELHELTEKGALSPEEFEREKQRLLGQETPLLAEVIKQESMPAIGTVLKSGIELVGTIGVQVATELKREIQKHNRRK